MGEVRPMRADARRNRAHIIEVAREVVELQGTMCSLDVVARAAGVGAGTLYRHFPTREDLLATILAEWVERVTADGADFRVEDEQSLRAWLDRLLDHATRFKGLSSALLAATASHESPLQDAYGSLLQANRDVLAQAAESGVVASSVDADGVAFAVAGAALVAEQTGGGKAAAQPILDIVAAGISLS